MRTLAIIPARGGSKRIPNKNIRNFLGKPIIAYSINTALDSDLFDEVMVSTDSAMIADVATNFGANIPFLRSDNSASDKATTVDVLIEVLSRYKEQGINFRYACCIYPTAPFISHYRLDVALKKLIREDLDTVMPVVPFSYPVQRSFTMDRGKLGMMMPEHLNTRSQDLETAYHDCGQFYWFDVERLLANKNLITTNTGAIIMPEMEVQDIDQESDWKLAELKYQLIHQFHENESISKSRRA
jgi:N-acylneuraminate cytidylyltransferase